MGGSFKEKRVKEQTRGSDEIRYTYCAQNAAPYGMWVQVPPSLFCKENFMRRRLHFGTPYIDYNGDGFFPIPSFYFHPAKDTTFNKVVYIDFGIVWGNRSFVLTLYTRSLL